jgi:hypothetical protein
MLAHPLHRPLARPLARPLIRQSTPALIPDAVWQVLIPPDTGVYNHPNESETPKITLPGGIHRLKLVVDQISSNYAGQYLSFSLYDADFNSSQRVLALYEILDSQGFTINEEANASQSDLFFDGSDVVASPASAQRYFSDLLVEVLASTVPLGLFSLTPDAESADPFSFRASLYLLSSAPLPEV